MVPSGSRWKYGIWKMAFCAEVSETTMILTCLYSKHKGGQEVRRLLVHSTLPFLLAVKLEMGS